ncbi:unnamed protein product [Closterium sp. NIES-54]
MKLLWLHNDKSTMGVFNHQLSSIRSTINSTLRPTAYTGMGLADYSHLVESLPTELHPTTWFDDDHLIAEYRDEQWALNWHFDKATGTPFSNPLFAYAFKLSFKRGGAVFTKFKSRMVAWGLFAVTASDEEIFGVTEDGGEPEVEQQQQDAPPHAERLLDHPRRDVRPPNRLTYPIFGKPKVVRAGSVPEQCDEDEIAHYYWATVSEPKTLAEALSGPNAEKWKQSVKEDYDSLLENETWEMCELPPGKKAISSNLIFRHNAVRQRLQRGAADLGKGEMLLTCYTDARFNSVKADGTGIGGYVCLFGGVASLELIGYMDTDDAGDKQKQTSTSDYVFVYGGAAVSWSSSRIKCATLSSTESEYVAATDAGKEGHLLRFLLAEFKLLDAGKPTILCIDNKLAITIAEGLGLMGNLKHMERRYT